MRYSSVNEKKEKGAHYTPKILSDFVAKKIISAFDNEDKHELVDLLDPAVGDGELLISMTNVLKQHGFQNVKVNGFEVNQDAMEYAKSRLNKYFPKIDISLIKENFLEFASNLDKQLRLFSQIEKEYFDIVIANPPYVRTQILGAKTAKRLAKEYNLTGRVDLYHAFILAISRVLKPGGIAGIIVSNRFLSTKSGKTVRGGILSNFDVLEIWDLGDTKIFDAAVLPAVLLLKKKNGIVSQERPKFTSIYSSKNDNVQQTVSDVITALDYEGIIKVQDGGTFRVRKGILSYDKDPKNVWRISNLKIEKWLDTVKKHTYCKFGDVGKVRVGVKTTADRVFIRSDWDEFPKDEYPELLRPVTTHHVARRYKPKNNEKNKKILYPHKSVQGKRVAVNLENYPNSSSYLEKNKERLSSRSYLIEAGRNWYEIWVPQDPKSWDNPKVVFRDISEKPVFWIDFSGSVVNGDCYWIVCNEKTKKDLLWLILAIGNSTFIERFYDYKFLNKLYAGRRRFITQYVKKFPLPDPSNRISKNIISNTKKIYNSIPNDNVKKLETINDQLVWEAFGVNQKNL